MSDPPFTAAQLAAIREIVRGELAAQLSLNVRIVPQPPQPVTVAIDVGGVVTQAEVLSALRALGASSPPGENDTV